ncbi:transposase [Streptomyces phaeoluteigriseus]|uniref:transposase n=1 Tax=Streptomyces phaeoluteigriseus TaxID=114686 RepID=UPI003EBA9674
MPRNAVRVPGHHRVPARRRPLRMHQLPSRVGHKTAGGSQDRDGRVRRGESLCRLDRAAYRRRNVVEHCFNKLKHNKALATRYDKRARHFQALVTLACLLLWLP